MSEWISVKDRLPELNTNVLVTDASGFTLDEREPIIVYYECGNWISICWWDYDYYHRVEGVTDWMPLPEPPKEEV